MTSRSRCRHTLPVAGIVNPDPDGAVAAAQTDDDDVVRAAARVHNRIGDELTGDQQQIIMDLSDLRDASQPLPRPRRGRAVARHAQVQQLLMTRGHWSRATHCAQGRERDGAISR